METEKRSVRWYEAAYIAVLLGVLVLSMTVLRPYRVGVINMGKAFQELGVAERLGQEMTRRQADVRAQFAALQQSAQEEEKTLLAAFRAAATDEARSRAQQNLAAFQGRLQKSRAEVAGEAQRFQRDAVVTFRERIRPHVQTVASRKRVDIVIEPEQVFQIMNHAADLTDEAIEAARGAFTLDQPLIDEELLKSRRLWIEAAPHPPTGPSEP